jgi:uncharacterized protein (TIGR02246 family)
MTEFCIYRKVRRMNAIVRVLIILVCVSVVWAIQNDRSSMPPDQQQAIEKAVLKSHNQMSQADSNLDVDKFFSYILDFDKGFIIQDGRLFRTRQEAYEAVKKGFEGISQLKRTYEQTYVTVISPETALLTAQGTSTVTLSDGQTFSRPFAVSTVYVLRDGQWKVLHGHYSVPNAR